MAIDLQVVDWLLNTLGLGNLGPTHHWLTLISVERMYPSHIYSYKTNKKIIALWPGPLKKFADNWCCSFHLIIVQGNTDTKSLCIDKWSYKIVEKLTWNAQCLCYLFQLNTPITMYKALHLIILFLFGGNQGNYMYRNNRKYLETQVLTNSVLRRLISVYTVCHSSSTIVDTSAGSNIDIIFFQSFRTIMVKS